MPRSPFSTRKRRGWGELDRYQHERVLYEGEYITRAEIVFDLSVKGISKHRAEQWLYEHDRLATAALMQMEPLTPLLQ